ncbi:MAG: hypothetical protein PVI97_17340 [Candidatus Thiodiazotropha sp.]|jgi:hypothetical protein
MNIKVIFGFLIISVLVSCSSTQKETMEVSEQLTSNYNDSEIKVWLMYGLKLNECRKSPIYSEFDCQVRVREEASRYWGILKVRDSASSKYFGDLEKTYLAGFIREYIWVFITKQANEQPENIRESEFREWAAKNISDHVPVVNPGIHFR